MPASDLIVERDESLLVGESYAVFSRCRTYRYRLVRRWGDGPLCVWAMLNPSDADAFRVDPTVGRCIDWSVDWGFGGMAGVNLFAFRSPHPAVMMAAADPVGPYNDAALSNATADAGRIICAWGNHGDYLGRAQAAAGIITAAARARGVEVLALGTTRSGAPIHPLARGRMRVPRDVVPVPYPIGA